MRSAHIWSESVAAAAAADAFFILRWQILRCLQIKKRKMKLKSNEQNKTDVSFNFAHSFVIVKVVLSTKKNKDGKKNAPEQKRFLFK